MERLDRFFLWIWMDGTSVSCKTRELSARSRNLRCWLDALARGREAHQSFHLVSTTCIAYRNVLRIHGGSTYRTLRSEMSMSRR